MHRIPLRLEFADNWCRHNGQKSVDRFFHHQETSQGTERIGSPAPIPMLSLQHQSQVGHGLVPNGQEEGGHRGDVSLSEDHLQRQLHHEQIYGSAQGSTGVDNSHVHSGEEEVPLGNSTLHGYPEGLHQFAYPAHMSTTDAPLQHYPYMVHTPQNVPPKRTNDLNEM